MDSVMKSASPTVVSVISVGPYIYVWYRGCEICHEGKSLVLAIAKAMLKSFSRRGHR